MRAAGVYIVYIIFITGENNAIALINLTRPRFSFLTANPNQTTMHYDTEYFTKGVHAYYMLL